MDYALRTFENLNWVTLVLVGCLLCYTLAKYLYPKRFQEFTMLPVTNKYFLVLGKGDEIKHPFNVLLFIPQVLAVSLFIYLFLKTQQYAIESPILFFIQICSIYSVFVLSKFMVEKLIGAIFNIEKTINRYLYQKLSYRNLLAIVIFLANLIFFYTYEPTPTILLIVLLVIAVLNGITLFYSYKTNTKLIFRELFYFILYLCALEISPYIILYKAFV
ncbi:MAG TPA: DUF4271 domain-containing protein [Flavobacteriaceae bacterium]|nr:DUF4271 domain-containing protein [Flavobacteriaceae bacterium]HIN98023.1 DUF4271 domain-containing protein [Flavobacteriaceae bacterium]